jgi:hypothetical protein
VRDIEVTYLGHLWTISLDFLKHIGPSIINHGTGAMPESHDFDPNPYLDFIHLWHLDQGLSEEERGMVIGLFYLSPMMNDIEKSPKHVGCIHILYLSNAE